MTRPIEESSCGHENQPLGYPLVAVSEEGTLPVLWNQALHRYLMEISQYELLSREETDELAVRFRETGDLDAAYRLVSANLRLVVKTAMDFQKHWMQNFMDLIQEGNIGLVQASKKFEPYRGVKFSYYAGFWIRAYMLKFIMDNWRLVKVGTTQGQRKLFFSLNKERKLLEAQGFAAEPKLLAQRMNVKESEVVEMSQRMDSCNVSLESPIYADSGDQKKNYIPTNGPGIESVIACKELKKKLAELLDILKLKLNDKQKMILHKRLLTDEPLTLQNIADSFGISRERVRQIEETLLKKMRIFFETEMPDILDFLAGDPIVLSNFLSSPTSH
ncbi:MAG: RNA polymerase factor sigma-32 [Pseudomonadota bacterium]